MPLGSILASDSSAARENGKLLSIEKPIDQVWQSYFDIHFKVLSPSPSSELVRQVVKPLKSRDAPFSWRSDSPWRREGSTWGPDRGSHVQLGGTHHVLWHVSSAGLPSLVVHGLDLEVTFWPADRRKMTELWLWVTYASQPLFEHPWVLLVVVLVVSVVVMVVLPEGRAELAELHRVQAKQEGLQGHLSSLPGQNVRFVWVCVQVSLRGQYQRGYLGGAAALAEALNPW